MARPPVLSARAVHALVLASALLTGAAAAPAAGAAVTREHSAAAASDHAVSGRTVSGRTASALPATQTAGTLPLLNGDLISVVRGASGKPAAVIRSARPGLGGALLHLTAGNASFLVPDDAVPYIGRDLDPSLFDLTTLAAAARSAGGRLPVTLAYHGRRPALPGVTITGAGSGRASGYLTAASARRFGAALRRQFLADHARDSYGTDGLFAGDLSISVAGGRGPVLARTAGRPSPSSPRAPGYVMHTLTVHGQNLAGKPDTGDAIFVINADNANRFGAGFTILTESASVFYHGVAKYSLPAGHYWAVAMFTGLNIPLRSMEQRIVVLPQFTVSGNSSVRVRARSASSHLWLKTPHRSNIAEITFQLNRAGAAGPAIGFGALAFSGLRVDISPTTRRPATGTLQTYTSGQFTSPRSVAQPYSYNLDYQDRSGLVHPQAIRVTPASLATVTARYYADAPSTGAVAPAGLYPGQPDPDIGFADILPVPEQRTEYYTAGRPAVRWSGEFFQDANTMDTGQIGTGHTFKPGEVTSEDWNAYPLHTSPNADAFGGLPSASPELVSASRKGNTLTVDMSPFADNTPGHNGAGYVSVYDGNSIPTGGSYEIDENGSRIAGGNATDSLGVNGDFFTQVKLAPGTDTLRLVMSATRTGKLYTRPTATSTAWTWRSASDAGTTIPAGWACTLSASTLLPAGHRCTPQPLLTLRYAVASLDLTGTAPAGPQSVAVHVGHMALTHAPAVTGLTAQVSFDDGATWQPATVTGNGPAYHLGFTAPASALVTLQVTAQDAGGGQITETITRGYATGPASTAPAGGMRPACPQAAAGQVRCYTVFAPQPAVNRALAAGRRVTPAGWHARDIESAYRLPAGRNPHQTVAVVDVHNSPNLATDLNAYRKQSGLRPCTKASGCLRIVNQRGKAGPLPGSGAGSGWDLETAADVEMVSAACPLCRILVVEANGENDYAISTAENTAARLGAAVISNSFGERETGLSMRHARAFGHRGHTIVVASGDAGFGAANFPANLSTVTAVGATELARAHNKRGWAERAWNTTEGGIPAATSSGCSAYVAKPAWQHGTHCGMRTTADVSAVGWNVAVYAKAYGGWLVAGGTSLSAPLIAGVYALAGNAKKVNPGHVYAHAARLFDITAGNNDIVTKNGTQCGRDYLCVAKKGYDAPTGLGTPNGAGAF